MSIHDRQWKMPFPCLQSGARKAPSAASHRSAAPAGKADAPDTVKRAPATLLPLARRLAECLPVLLRTPSTPG